MAYGSPLFGNSQPGGLFAVVEQSFTTGDVYFVDSATGTNAAGAGRSPRSPFATIDYAVGNCTAGKRDVIYVMPGHAETVSAAAGLDFDVAGITVIGIGDGANTPTVTLDTAITADVDVDAANVTVKNIHFRANFADITAAIDVNATDFTLDGCRFSDVAANMNVLIWVQDAAAAGSDRITIQNCHAIALDAANTHFVNFAGTGTGHIVRDNTLIGDWGTMCVGGAGVITACLIRGNLIYNAATTNDACIQLANTATGILFDNHGGGGAAQANGFKADGCTKSQNYYGDLIDASAILDPIAT